MSKNKKSGKKKVIVTKSDQTKKRVVTAKKVENKKSKKISPTTSKLKRKGSSAAATLTQQNFIFERKNYLLMLGGIGLMAIGFLLMLGGHMPSPDVWEPERIYSFRRITLAPILILAGLGLEVFAIFKKF